MRLRVLITIAIVVLWLACLAWGEQPVFPRFSVAPRTCNAAAKGFAYFNTTSGLPFVCNGVAWVDITVAGTVDTAALEAALPVSDATALVKGTGDVTKRVRLEADGCATGTTCALTVTSNTTAPIAAQPLTITGPTAPRSYALPDADATIPALGTTNAFTGANSFVDGNFTILGSSDATKKARLEVDALTTGVTRVLNVPDVDTFLPVYPVTITYGGASAPRTVTYPDQDFTVAGLGVSQTFAGANVASGQWTFGTAAGAINACTWNETAGQLTCEGAAADAAEHRFNFSSVNAGFDTLTTFTATGTTQSVIYDVGTQTFTGQKDFSNTANGVILTGATYLRIGANASSRGMIGDGGVQTNNTPWLGTGTASNAWCVGEQADITFNYQLGAQTDPTLCILSHNQNVDQRMGLRHNGTQGQVVDLANTGGASRPIGFMGGAAVASAGTITPTGNVFHVTGTTNITAITAMASGTTICAIFDGILTVTDNNGALDTAGNFVTSANDTMCLVSDGTNWYETSRAVN